ncbi:MAG TPA: hypothetical protein VFR24_05515 [Candidatus Angelobacter sp.]|nr:hypothetical protein [Candidatus Angelobacter sp.]
MTQRILSVAYDESLLATRQMLLETHGYNVISALGFTQAVSHCKTGGFDLFILGHSISLADKRELIKTFRTHCRAPILSLGRVDEELVESDFHVFADKPEKLIQSVAKIFDGNFQPSQPVRSMKRRNKAS